MCRSKGLPVSGKKQVLIARLEKASARAESADATDSTDSSESRNMEASIRVTRSVYGNYTFKDLVIDRDTGVCVGYEKLGGTVLPLTAQHIEKCLQYRLEYRMPHNLDEGEDDDDDNDDNDESDENDENDENDGNDDEEENDDDEVEVEVEVEVEMTDDEIIEEYEYEEVEEVEEEVEEVEDDAAA